VLWSLLVVVAIVLALHRGTALIAAARGRTLAMLFASAVLIATNWAVYIWAVDTGHVIEASLGYFINPLVNVLLGVALLGEALRRVQLLAVLIAAMGVLALTLAGGGALWISLTLAVTFAFYGFVRKIAAIDALGGLTVETLLLGLPAATLLAIASYHGNAAFGPDVSTDLLLVLAGVVTTVPLLLFAAAARRLPLVTLGLLQYIAPTLQFLIGALAFGERMLPIDRFAFPLIWLGCLVYAYDGAHNARTLRAEGSAP
jgi:chloramphenicol-sensitive protein RarD